MKPRVIVASILIALGVFAATVDLMSGLVIAISGGAILGASL